MNTLLLRLAGPMQSWGVQSRFLERDTGLEPSKSGVIGLLCAAKGWNREEADSHFQRLANLKMGVRIDRPGVLLHDFQTAQKVRIASASKVNLEKGTGLKGSISTRYYLADAAFLVGLEGEDSGLLRELDVALRNPRWLLYLGRKAFVPSPPVWLKDGLWEGKGLMEALTGTGCYPWLGREGESRPERLRVVIEDWEEGYEVRPDQPLSFTQRRFAPRRVTSTSVASPSTVKEGP